MRLRNEIEDDFYETTSYNGHITVTEKREKEKLMLEVLLDIRNLLSLDYKSERLFGFAEPGDEGGLHGQRKYDVRST